MAQAKPGLLAEKQPFEGKVSGRVRYTVHPATSKLNPTFILGEPAAVDGDRAAASGKRLPRVTAIRTFPGGNPHRWGYTFSV